MHSRVCILQDQHLHVVLDMLRPPHTYHYTKIIVVRACVHMCIRTRGHRKPFDLEQSYAMCLTTEH